MPVKPYQTHMTLRNWKKDLAQAESDFQAALTASMKPMGFWLLNKLLLMQLIKHSLLLKLNWLLYATKRSKHQLLKWHTVQQLQRVLGRNTQSECRQSGCQPQRIDSRKQVALQKAQAVPAAKEEAASKAANRPSWSRSKAVEAQQMLNATKAKLAHSPGERRYTSG